MLLTGTAAGTSGCRPSYDCVAACEPHAEWIANDGFVPDGGGICTHSAIQNASTCGQCYDAIEAIHRVGIYAVACDCPAAEMDSTVEISVMDESCSVVPKPWNVETCFEYNTRAFRGCAPPF